MSLLTTMKMGFAKYSPVQEKLADVRHNPKMCIRDSHRLHEPVHSPDTDMNAIITFKNIGYFICAKSFLGFGINM